MKNETAQQFVQLCYDKIQCYSPPREHDLTRVFRAVQDKIEELEEQIQKQGSMRDMAEAVIKSWKEDEGADAKRFAWLCENIDMRDIGRSIRHDALTDRECETLSLSDGVDKVMLFEAKEDER